MSTKDKQYAGTFNELIRPALDRAPEYSIASAVLAIPYFGNHYRERLRPYVEKYKKEHDELLKQHPYGIPLGTRHWAGDAEVVSWVVTNYHLHKAFQNIIGPEYAIRGIDYIFSCHPYSNISFVAGVGTDSKKIAYGNNRADFSFIAGDVVPGVLVLQPDFPENQENWPFIWDENECVRDICADYILLSNVVTDLLNNRTGPICPLFGYLD